MNELDNRKALFDLLESSLEGAYKQGPDGVIEYLKALSYSLGAQVAIVSKPEHIPDMINEVMTTFGHGLQSGMRELHGLNGKFNVHVNGVVTT
ncbi:hypothetical protein MKX34_17375 [Paenibacillus sp. FSL R5-0636]|uniref:hypothetical protein n=1 Tax=Paenibacillus TaxID=44249 RepID=UPI00096BEE78|nr:hypothetical protein [Paenibacillus odorifer]OMD03450.1 hypothetical protein BJP49_01145 [Paenibacillus odorifer]